MPVIRAFIALPLPYELKQDVQECIEKIKQSAKIARWIPEDNWHATVLPPQRWDGEEISDYICTVQERVDDTEFSLRTREIILGPNAKNPRMIWLVCEPSQGFARLKQSVRAALTYAGAPLDAEEKREDVIHVTLARFNTILGSRIAWKNVACAHEFSVRSLEVLKSELKSTGAVYTKLGEIELAET